jgi:integrase
MSDLSGWLDEWDLVLRNGNVAEQTRVVYLRSARQFLAHLADHHPDVTDPGQITRRHVDSWLRAMNEAGRSENTRRIRLKALRLWLGYLGTDPDSGVVGNPAAAVPLPAEYVKPVPVVPDEAVARLLATTAGVDFVDRRDAGIIRMLFDTGCRRGELVALDLDDIDLRHQEAMIRRGKGNKSRAVPFGGRTALALTRYVRSRGRHQAAAVTPALFLAVRPGSVSGSPWRLTGKGVADMLERRCAQAGIPAINPHAFRHSWAHDLMANGANESDVERLAGWSSPLMVRRYGNSAADARARDAARKLARGDRL